MAQQQESKEVIIKLNNSLAESQNSKNKAPYTCHVLPCQINYTGTTSTTSKYFHVVKVDDDLDNTAQESETTTVNKDKELPTKVTELNTENNRSILSSTDTIINQPSSTEPSTVATTEEEPQSYTDKQQTYHYETYFRGRLLKGVDTSIPDNYIGVLLKEGPCQSKVLPKNGVTVHSNNDDGYDDYDMGEAEDDYEDSSSTPVQTKLEKIWAPVVTFDKVVVWGHEKIPNKENDQYLTAINDWISLSHIIHE